MLFLLGVVLLLFLLVLVMAEIHGLRDRRHGRGRYENQIESELLSFPEGGGGRHHLRGSIRKHGADFARTDELVHVLSAILPARRKVSTWIHWLCEKFRVG